MISLAAIDRLGFEEFAFNFFLNYGILRDGFRYEENDATITIKLVGDQYAVAVRCYVEGRGWLVSEFNHKPTLI
jgi:hypothetical protein